MKSGDFYEAKLYMGSVDYSSRELVSQHQVELFCGKVHEECDIVIPVRITPTTFISETNYQEGGWEIAAINYPKFDFSRKQVKEFIMHLADRLLTEFNQRTICVVDDTGYGLGKSVIMLENDDG
tara:strand:+ start:64 stop:435 length:372 start_codon:yes stop_codon:yes gene_type:complete